MYNDCVCACVYMYTALKVTHMLKSFPGSSHCVDKINNVHSYKPQY